jgi:hypothetical protein
VGGDPRRDGEGGGTCVHLVCSWENLFVSIERGLGVQAALACKWVT